MATAPAAKKQSAPHAATANANTQPKHRTHHANHRLDVRRRVRRRTTCRQSTTPSRSTPSTRASRSTSPAKCSSTWAAAASAASPWAAPTAWSAAWNASTPARPVKVPVGKATLGRVFNLLGEPIDGRGPVDADEYWPIHRDPPPLSDLSTKTELFETGIKVIDLLTPFVRGGKAGLFGGAGLGKTVILTELIARIARPTAATRCSPASASGPAKAPTSGWKCRKPRSATPAAASSSRPAWSSAR